MAGKKLDSADELNIDSFFSEQSVKSDAVADESEEDKPDTSQDAPDETTGGKGKKQADANSEDDTDLEDEEDSEDGDDDLEDDDDSEDEDDLDEEDLGDKKNNVSKKLNALTKKANNAELQRAQMQSERDAYKAQMEKANLKIDSLDEKIEKLTNLTNKLTKKTEQSNVPDFFTGDDDALMTEGQIKKMLEKQAKLSRKADSNPDDDETYMTAADVKRLLKEQSKTSEKSESQDQPKIGSDLEAQRMWADRQPDVDEVGSYYAEHKAALDPELATIQSIDGRYLAVRNKRIESELKATKKALRKAKQKISRMSKGELPETASGKRSKPPAINENRSNDPIDKFFAPQ
jgi:hypothetical protein